MKTQLAKTFFVLFCFGPFSLALAEPMDVCVSAGSQGEQVLLRGVNAYRAEHHLAPLVANPLIATAAKQHSQDMANHRTPFGHQGMRQRMHQLFNHYPHSRSASENVAYTFENAPQGRSHTNQCANHQISVAVLQRVVNMWIDSPPHRHSMLGHYNLTGLGIAEGDQGKLYFTELFLRTS